MTKKPNDNPFIDGMNTPEHISAGLALLQDIEMFRSAVDKSTSEPDLSGPGAMGYHLFVEALRNAVLSLDEGEQSPLMQEVKNA